MRTVLLVYDIPKSCAARNPSARLRRLGVRVNLSCWVLPEENVPHELLDRLGRGGACWHLVPFAAADPGQVLKVAAEVLTGEVERLTRSLERSVANAQGRLESTAPSAEKLAAFRRRTREVLRRAERLLADSLAGAEALGVGPDALPLAAARSRALAARSAAEAHAHLYAEALARLADGPLKAAVEADAVPACVLADALEEQGQDAASLGRAFAG